MSCQDDRINCCVDFNCRIDMARQWICPDCGSALKKVPAREMHPEHDENETARACPNEGCEFMCFFGEENGCCSDSPTL